MAELSTVNVCLLAGDDAELARKESLYLSLICRFGGFGGTQRFYIYSQVVVEGVFFCHEAHTVTLHNDTQIMKCPFRSLACRI